MVETLCNLFSVVSSAFIFLSYTSVGCSILHCVGKSLQLSYTAFYSGTKPRHPRVLARIRTNVLTLLLVHYQGRSSDTRLFPLDLYSIEPTDLFNFCAFFILLATFYVCLVLSLRPQISGLIHKAKRPSITCSKPSRAQTWARFIA